MRFAPKHVVTMVCAVSAAVVLAPVGVMAATGQYVNIVDPFASSRRARVGSTNTLQVESRAGSVAGAFNLTTERVVDVIGHTIYEADYPKRIAVTEATFTVRGTGTTANDVRLFYQVRTSGTAPCGASGWSMPKTLRSVVVRQDATVQLLFNGPPLLLPKPAAGQRYCLRFQQTLWNGGTELDVGVTGFTFE